MSTRKKVDSSVAEKPESISQGGDEVKPAVSDRLAKFEELKRRKEDAAQANRQDVYAEHRKLKTNVKAEVKAEKKRKDAERLQEKRVSGRGW